jgi:acyl-CoA synthetase (AMP-forming)/AMP-acid ligase II
MHAPGGLVHGLLEASASDHADLPLVLDTDRAHSYADINGCAGKLAKVLQAHGVGRGDRVALLAENSAFYVTAYYGILKAGAVAVPLNTSSTPEDLCYFLDNCSASAMIVGTAHERVVARALAGHLRVRTVLTEKPGRLGELCAPSGANCVDLASAIATASPFSDESISSDDLASLIYTSGSTGRPRGVMLTHANIIANTRSIVSYLDLTSADRVLALLPFYYVFGKSLLNTHVAVGGSVVIENRLMYPTVALDTLERAGCTGLPGVPSTFQILLDQTDLERRRFPSLRYVCQAGGPMSPATTRRLMRAVAGKQVFVMYGCTEASARLAYIPPEDLADHVGKIGKAIPGVHLRVLREDGTEADTDEVGELVANGPNIMQGYWGDPELTASVLDRHGLHTGDLARRDAFGYLTIVGRAKDMIKSGGHRISPVEIENVITDNPHVAEVAVVGVPDRRLGEAIVAIVVPKTWEGSKSTHLHEDLRREIGMRLGRNKVPENVIFRQSLPKNAVGKVLKQQLRDEFANGPMSGTRSP